MIPDLATIARRYDSFETVDASVFQQTARILQSFWREAQGYPVGVRGDRRYGTRLAMPWARESLANYMTDAANEAVRREVLDPVRSKNKLYGKPRIFDNLLSSQPLCFNLFAELQADLSLATAFVRSMGMRQVASVTAIEFEHSPAGAILQAVEDAFGITLVSEYDEHEVCYFLEGEIEVTRGVERP